MKYLKIVIFMGLIFMLSGQPILLMMSLVGLVLMYSFLIYMGSSSFWFSYIYLLVMMSGVLVLFSYLVSLFPNSEVEYGNFYLMLGMSIMFFMLKVEFFDFFDIGEYMLYMWSSLAEVLTLFLVLFLFGVMVVVVWVSMMDEGSLREN